MTITATVDQVAVDLYAAAQVIRERGWTVGTVQADDGRVCVYGAICIAVAGHTSRSARIEPALFRTRIDPASRAVEVHLDLPHPDVPGARLNVETWSDLYCESGDEAVDLLERVAAERAGDGQ